MCDWYKIINLPLPRGSLSSLHGFFHLVNGDCFADCCEASHHSPDCSACLSIAAAFSSSDLFMEKCCFLYAFRTRLCHCQTIIYSTFEKIVSIAAHRPYLRLSVIHHFAGFGGTLYHTTRDGLKATGYTSHNAREISSSNIQSFIG